MNIQIDSKSAAWYKEELNLQSGDFVRFFVRYGGHSTIQTGFSLGISKDTPFDIGAKVNVDGITYFIEEKDLWYFEEHDLIVEFKSDYNEPVFHYKKGEN
jgi:uncharacterized protein YneR